MKGDLPYSSIKAGKTNKASVRQITITLSDPWLCVMDHEKLFRSLDHTLKIRACANLILPSLFGAPKTDL